MFKDPVRAAIMYWNQKNGRPLDGKIDKHALHHHIIPEVVAELTEHYQGCLAPPQEDRPVGLQEVETILCKWKSHMNGHYPVGLDNEEIREGVLPWVAHSNAARQFLECLPR